MRVLFLNQYFPPDPAPTGLLFREVGEELLRRGHEVSYAGASQAYDLRRHRNRAAREMRALVGVFRAALRTARPQVVVAGSSPPCLLPVAALVAVMRGARLVHWAMDLYPELAVALGEVREGAVLRMARAGMAAGYRKAATVVAVDEDMWERLRAHHVEAQVIRPWVPGGLVDPGEKTSGGLTWLYSGNLGRAHEWETLLETQALLEAQGSDATLVFQGGGPATAPAKVRAAELGLRRCVWRDASPRDSFLETILQARVLIATQRPEVRGLLWPSKLALMMHLSQPLLWVGPTEGAVAEELQKRGNAGIFAPGDSEGVARWLRSLPTAAPAPVDWEGVRKDRDTALSRWVSLIAGS